MNNKRNKRGPVRPPRNRSVNSDGVYSNHQFMSATTAQIGTNVRVLTKGGELWDGIFRTLSANCEIVLEVATRVDEANDSMNSNNQKNALYEKLIIQSDDLVSMSARDVDPLYATRDTFQTDSAISARLNGQSREVGELEPWDGELNGTDTPSLELDSTANGWDANDMFKKNELEYGVTSTFDHSLRGYTVPLQHSDTPDYKEAEAKANQIANEIESKPSRMARLELENGDEEAAYAAVARPTSDQPNGKYIPPAKRKNNNQTAGKTSRTSPPPTSTVAPPSAGAAIAGPAPQSVAPPPQTQGPSSKSAQTSPVTTYASAAVVSAAQTQRPPQSEPVQAQQQSQGQQQQMAVQIQPQGQQQPQMPQNQGHAPRQNHGYGNNRGQGQRGQHMNGDSSKLPRGPRVFQPPLNAPSQTAHPANNYQEQPPKMAEMNHNNNRHHREEVKELQQFAQDFQISKDAVSQGPPAQPMPEQQVMQPCPQQQQPNLKTQPEMVQPQPSPSPKSTDGAAVDKVTTVLKNTAITSTLNPNAKEFVLNPQAKTFAPSFNSRAPSTSSMSRPHTPQTPSHPQFISATMNGPMGQPPSMIVPVSYMMPGQAQYHQQQAQGNRIRKMPAGQIRGADCLSPMQVAAAAATGQPLLAPAPMGQFVYQPGLNPATYHQMHGMRMYDAPPQIQYLPPQAAAQQGQPQYAQGQPPQAQAPPQQYQAGPPPQGGVQAHQYLPMCNLIPQPHMLQGVQYIPQVPPPQHPLPLILQHNQQHQVHQGPA